MRSYFSAGRSWDKIGIQPFHLCAGRRTRYRKSVATALQEKRRRYQHCKAIVLPIWKLQHRKSQLETVVLVPYLTETDPLPPPVVMRYLAYSAICLDLSMCDHLRKGSRRW